MGSEETVPSVPTPPSLGLRIPARHLRATGYTAAETKGSCAPAVCDAVGRELHGRVQIRVVGHDGALCTCSSTRRAYLRMGVYACWPEVLASVKWESTAVES